MNNEAQVDIEVVQVKVEMQTVTVKVTLFELDGDGSGTSAKGGQVLGAGDVLENVVHHEIKELGQHVLACAVTYRLPPNARPIPGAAEDANDPSLVTFRKFYKFAVSGTASCRVGLSPTLDNTIGDQSTLGEDQSTRSKISNRPSLPRSARQSLPRGSHPESYTRTHAFRADATRAY